MTKFRMMLLGTAAVGLTAATISSASAGEVEKKFSTSGHVNRAIVMGDDGKDNFVLHTDPSGISQTRGRFKASAKSESLSIGSTIELALSSNAGGDQHAGGTDSFAIRHSYVWLSNAMGRIRMGDTAHAGEGYLGTDMSATGNAEGIWGSTIDGILFNNTTTVTNQAAGASVGTAHGSDFSAGRASGISYDTPSLGGFKGSISHVQSGSGSVEGKYKADFDGVKVEVGAMWTSMNADATDDRSGVGAGVKLANGLSFSTNFKTTDLEGTLNTTNRPDPELWYSKIGYELGLSDMGKTGVAVAYKKIDDLAASGDEFTSLSFLMQQSLSDYGSIVYGSITNATYDTSLANFSDITAATIGLKVVF
jgi:hypothetical protein